MRFVFLTGVLMMGGAVGFAVAQGHRFGKASVVAIIGLVLGLTSLARLSLGDPAALAGGVQAAASPVGLINTIADGIGFVTTAAGLGLGFLVGVLLAEWDA